MTFDEAYAVLESLQTSRFSYEPDACRLLWETAMKVPPCSEVVEVGCEFGRSSALLAMAAAQSHSHVTCIDPFCDPGSADVFMRNMRKVGLPFTLHVMRSVDAEPLLPRQIALAHIDGDHTAQGIEADCALLIPHIALGGYVVFHDYGRDSLPDVWPAADRWTLGWEHVGTAQTCHVMRRLG